MDKIIDYLKFCWKGVLTVVGVLAVITALTTFYSTLATSADLVKIKEETNSAIGQLKKSMDLDRNINRLNQINDSLMRAKILQKTYPNDRELKEDIETLKRDKMKLQQRIEER